MIAIGSVPFTFYETALQSDKPIIVQMERLFKQGKWKMLYPKVLNRYYQKYVRTRKSNIYYLCASAYAAADLKFLGICPERLFTWGYTPEYQTLDLDSLFEIRRREKCRILWVGRLISWKRCEDALKVARLLKLDRCDFSMQIIGTGNQEQKLKQIAKSQQLDDVVEFVGSVPSDRITEYMKQAHVFLATSDFNEGWGVVINEAMNHGCAVVASHAMGSVPVMIEHGQNGMIYPSGDVRKAYEIISDFVKNSDKRERLGSAAYQTVWEQFSPEIAAVRLCELSESVLNGEVIRFSTGLGSPAPIYKNSDYQKIIMGDNHA